MPYSRKKLTFFAASISQVRALVAFVIVSWVVNVYKSNQIHNTKKAHGDWRWPDGCVSVALGALPACDYESSTHSMSGAKQKSKAMTVNDVQGISSLV